MEASSYPRTHRTPGALKFIVYYHISVSERIPRILHSERCRCVCACVCVACTIPNFVKSSCLWFFGLPGRHLMKLCVLCAPVSTKLLMLFWFGYFAQTKGEWRQNYPTFNRQCEQCWGHLAWHTNCVYRIPAISMA